MTQRAGKETEAKSIEHNAIDDWLGYYLKKMGKVALVDEADQGRLVDQIEAGQYADRTLRDLLQEDDPTLGPRVKGLQQMREMGEQAKQQLVEANLRLVVSIAKNYSGKGVPFLDLIQQGNLGLILALQNYTPDKRAKYPTFSTWAGFKIRECIIRCFYTQSLQGPVKQTMGEKLSKLSNKKRKLREELGREATKEELAEAMGLSIDDIFELLYLGNDHMSYDMEIDESGTSLGEILKTASPHDPEKALVAWSLGYELEKMLSDLDLNEQIVIRDRYGLEDGEPKTYDAIGRGIGVGFAAARAMERSGLQKMRTHEDASALEEYLY